MEDKQFITRDELIAAGAIRDRGSSRRKSPSAGLPKKDKKKGKTQRDLFADLKDEDRLTTDAPASSEADEDQGA